MDYSVGEQSICALAFTYVLRMLADMEKRGLKNAMELEKQGNLRCVLSGNEFCIKNSEHW